MTMRIAVILVLLGTLLSLSHGFVQPSPRIALANAKQSSRKRGALNLPPTLTRHDDGSPRTHSVACNGFNLPPGKNDKGGLQDILVGAASIVGLLAFFLSPLGALFFAALNSVLVLVFITPLLLIFAFNAWQFFNTVEGNCPSCSAPVRVLKDGSPSICFSCGSVLQSNDGKIDFAPNVNQFEQDDSMFGGMFSDVLGSQQQQQPEEREKKYKREQTIIDVDIEDVEK